MPVFSADHIMKLHHHIHAQSLQEKVQTSLLYSVYVHPILAQSKEKERKEVEENQKRTTAWVSICAGS